MNHGKKSDYAAPFIDIERGGNLQRDIDRVVSIGHEPLLSWWERIKTDTSPSTYGQTNHEFTSGVAYLIAGGKVSRYAHNRIMALKPENLGDKYLAAWRQAEHTAAIQLGATINFA